MSVFHPETGTSYGRTQPRQLERGGARAAGGDELMSTSGVNTAGENGVEREDLRDEKERVGRGDSDGNIGGDTK